MFKICERKDCSKPFKTNRSKRRFCSTSCSNIFNGLKKRNNIKKPTTIVWACGGGIDSVAIAMMICRDILPKPDIAVMMDCGYESTTTIKYINNVVIPRLAAKKIEFNLIRSSDYGADLSCLDRQKLVRIPAFRKLSDGRIIKLKTWCNSEWKLKPCKRWLREQGVNSYINWIGFSADEKRRIKPTRNKNIINAYPLIEHGWTRERCVYELGSYNWPLPSRSSCLICPNQKDEQWLSINAVENDWNKVIENEKEIQIYHPDTFLHKSCMLMKDVINQIKNREGG